MDAAAAARNMTVQLCAGNPPSLLQGLMLPTMTQARGSIDYAWDTAPKSISSPHNWAAADTAWIFWSTRTGLSKASDLISSCSCSRSSCSSCSGSSSSSSSSGTSNASLSCLHILVYSHGSEQSNRHIVCFFIVLICSYESFMHQLKLDTSTILNVNVCTASRLNCTLIILVVLWNDDYGSSVRFQIMLSTGFSAQCLT